MFLESLIYQPQAKELQDHYPFDLAFSSNIEEVIFDTPISFIVGQMVQENQH